MKLTTDAPIGALLHPHKSCVRVLRILIEKMRHYYPHAIIIMKVENHYHGQKPGEGIVFNGPVGQFIEKVDKIVEDNGTAK
ncbi:MAG: hypothetical protein IJQ60_09480 [Prevotella sp.]|nr:hypothetical protein [Prevotella sp.]